MLRPKRIYFQKLNIDRETLQQRFLQSSKFIACIAEPYVNAFKQSQKDELFISIRDTYSFRISENCGFGGVLEVIGSVEISLLDNDTSSLKIKIQTGIFPANFPQLVILTLLIIGLILFPWTNAFSVGILIICLIPAIWWLINYFKIKSFLRILSSAIEIDNKWI